MKFREVDARLRNAFSLSALTLVSGFIGVSLADTPDSIENAKLALGLVVSLGFLHRFLTEDDERTLSWWLLSFVLAVFSWFCSASLTQKPFLMASVYLAWMSASVVFQAGKVGRDLDGSFERIEAKLDRIAEIDQHISDLQAPTTPHKEGGKGQSGKKR